MGSVAEGVIGVYLHTCTYLFIYIIYTHVCVCMVVAIDIQAMADVVHFRGLHGVATNYSHDSLPVATVPGAGSHLRDHLKAGPISSRLASTLTVILTRLTRLVSLIITTR